MQTHMMYLDATDMVFLGKHKQFSYFCAMV